LRKLNLARSSKNKIHISEIEIGSNRSRARTIANGRNRIGAQNINAYLIEQLMRARHFHWRQLEAFRTSASEAGANQQVRHSRLKPGKESAAAKRQ
jgi:hypothetical protein